MISKCPICALSLPNQPTSIGDAYYFDCKSCGRFAASYYALNKGDEISEDKNIRNRLKHLMCENRLKRAPPIFFATSPGVTPAKGYIRETIDERLETYPKTPLEYYDRALENLARMANHPVASLTFTQEHWPALFTEEGLNVELMLRQLQELDYLTFGGTIIDRPNTLIVLRSKGWERVQTLATPGRDSKQAFVAMWFGPTHRHYYDDAIKPAIEADKKYAALRIDTQEHNNRIDDQIIAEIRRSRFLVADFTEHRPGVYFETGFALGIGIPVIWTVQKDHLKQTHFDTRQYNHIDYRSPEELKERLMNRIRATIV